MSISHLYPQRKARAPEFVGPSPRGNRPRSLSRLAGLLALVLIAAGLAFVISRTIRQHSLSTPINFIPPDMHLVYDGTFTSNSLNPSNFDTCFPWANTPAGCSNFGNPELQWFLPSQVGASGNTLNLTASKIPTTGTNPNGSPQTFPWRSGMITTFNSFQFTYGYVQFTAQVPAGNGMWSTFWLLPKSTYWPPEIDIAAILGSNPKKVSVFYHPTGAGRVPEGTAISSKSYATGFHTYALDWEPNSLTWYVDGHKIEQYRGTTPSIPMYLLADLAVEDTFGDGPDASTPPNAVLAIKEIKVFQKSQA